MDPSVVGTLALHISEVRHKSVSTVGFQTKTNHELSHLLCRIKKNKNKNKTHQMQGTDGLLAEAGGWG